MRRRLAERDDYYKYLVSLLAVVAIFAGCAKQTPTPPPTEPPGAGREEPQQVAADVPEHLKKALSEFNRGAALMEQYKYSRAAEAFETVLALCPGWTAARFNLGLAYFNMHGSQGAEENLDIARRSFEKVLASDPDNLRARFCLGLYYEYFGEGEKALAHFQAVYESDGDDPHAAYKYAEALIGAGRNEEGTKILERVVEMDPGFVSAVYRLAIQYTRMKQRDKAMPLFERFKKLNAVELAGGSFGVQKVYGTVGKYYLALGADDLPLAPSEATAVPRVVFSPRTRPLDARVQRWQWGGGAVNLPGIAVGDVDRDGDLDLCLTAVGQQQGTSFWLNDGSGGFSAGTQPEEKGVSPCLGDVDNDGDLDLWLGCAGSDVLLKNDGKGTFEQATPSAVAAGDLLTACSRLLDLDSDGDLDLVALRLKSGSVPPAGEVVPGTNSVYNNNRDGSFADIASNLGQVFAKTPIAAVAYDDFDNDRDLDLVLFPAGAGSPVALVNDRVWNYRTLESAATGLAVDGVVAATSGDPNKDAERDLLVFTGAAVRLCVNRGRFRFETHQGFADRCGRLGGTGGQFADMDNDGDLDVVIADAHRRDGSRGPALLINDWPRDRFLNAAEVDPGNLLAAVRTDGDASCVVADFTGNGRCDVLLAPVDGQPLLLENVTPDGNWIELDLHGTSAKDNKSRSNGSAIGARVEIKTGSVFQQFVLGTASGPVAMPPLRVHAGLGENPTVDWLRIIWPDAVLQAELELPGNRLTAVSELSRKTSSCPCLFAWNGSRFEFVADFGGVGGVGYLVSPGVYAPPDPSEYLRIPALEPLDGQYVIQALTLLEEVTYFDEAKLIAVDHPSQTEVYPNEMMAITVEPPSFEVFCYAEPIEPLAAVDHRGVDVTDELRDVDRRYAGATSLDHRFTGIAEEHFVELDFGDQLKTMAGDSRLVLFLFGWVEYGYSATNFAASQAKVRTKAPSIHVLREGRWVELFNEVGYPAGLQHVMTLELTGKLLPSDRRIRISGNMEIYWDRIFLAEHLEGVAVLREVAAGSADLHYRGYPREYTPDGHHPNLCDYDNLDRAVGWKLMSGDYTRFGDVAELIDEADDCYVIMGHGEEITLRFAADAFGPLAPGRRRTFILKTDSFCKDMDLYTAHPDTVEPLPFHAMSGYPYGDGEHYPDTDKTRQYRQRYNTRRVKKRGQDPIWQDRPFERPRKSPGM